MPLPISHPAATGKHLLSSPCPTQSPAQLPSLLLHQCGLGSHTHRVPTAPLLGTGAAWGPATSHGTAGQGSGYSRAQVRSEHSSLPSLGQGKHSPAVAPSCSALQQSQGIWQNRGFPCRYFLLWQECTQLKTLPGVHEASQSPHLKRLLLEHIRAPTAKGFLSQMGKMMNVAWSTCRQASPSVPSAAIGVKTHCIGILTVQLGLLLLGQRNGAAAEPVPPTKPQRDSSVGKLPPATTICCMQ